MTLTLLLLAVFATSLLSAVVGMAGGLVLKGVLIALVPVTSSMIIHGWIQMIANGARAWGLREHIQWRSVGLYCMGASVAVMGFLLFPWVPSPLAIYLVLGLLPFVGMLTPKQVRPDFSRKWDAILTGLSVNATQLLAGVAGPILDLAFLDSRLNKKEVVASKAITQTISHLTKVVCYAWIGLKTFTIESSEFPWSVILVGPVLAIAGTRVGARILERISEKRFRDLGRIAITLIGVVYLGIAGWLIYQGS